MTDQIYICKGGDADFDIYAKIIRREGKTVFFRRWQKQGALRISDSSMEESVFMNYYRPATKEEIHEMKD